MVDYKRHLFCQDNTKNEGAASFRHNPKRARIPLKIRFLRSNFMLCCFFRLKFCEFLLFMLFLYRRFLAQRTFVRLSLVSRRFLL